MCFYLCVRTWSSHSVYSMVTDIHIINTLPSSDHLPVGLVISTCVTADKIYSVPIEKQGVKKFPTFKISARAVPIRRSNG